MLVRFAHGSEKRPFFRGRSKPTHAATILLATRVSGQNTFLGTVGNIMVLELMLPMAYKLDTVEMSSDVHKI